mgnify:CR=1 FL=1
MKPFLVSGLTDKARYDYGLKVAQTNNYIFEAFDAKDFESYSKKFLTSTLGKERILFFIFDADKLSQTQAEQFLKLVADSPHIFLLSAPALSGFAYILQKNCLKTNLGSSQSQLQFALQSLMTVEDRNAVRLAIESVDPLFLFHILKRDCWKVPEALTQMLRISQYVYKSKKTYITSLLALALPKKAFAMTYKKSTNDKIMNSILTSVAKLYKCNSSEAADIYLLIKKMGFAPEELQLSDEQRNYLGLPPTVGEEQAPEAPVIIANLEDYF